MMMATKTWAVLLISLLMCSVLSTFAARPWPSSSNGGVLAKTHQEGLVAEKYKEGMEGVSCDGVGEEACLMRRTLNAHLDYIYTQSHKP